MNVLIPMAGRGSRFTEAGYSDPKPLIDVEGLPMIVRVIENMGPTNNFVFVVRSDMPAFTRLKNLLHGLKPNCRICFVDEMTQGAAETCLAAKWEIHTDQPLLIANCDQIQEWDPDVFRGYATTTGHDGVIVTFTSRHPGNSYVRVNDDGFVTEVAEKKVISNIATTGIYYWKHGYDFVRCAMQMISKDIRVNNEFYVCPVYNEIIQEGAKVSTYHIEKHWPIGVPSDLDSYLARQK